MTNGQGARLRNNNFFQTIIYYTCSRPSNEEQTGQRPPILWAREPREPLTATRAVGRGCYLLKLVIFRETRASLIWMIFLMNMLSACYKKWSINNITSLECQWTIKLLFIDDFDICLNFSCKFCSINVEFSSLWCRQ